MFVRNIPTKLKDSLIILTSNSIIQQKEEQKFIETPNLSLYIKWRNSTIESAMVSKDTNVLLLKISYICALEILFIDQIYWNDITYVMFNEISKANEEHMEKQIN